MNEGNRGRTVSEPAVAVLAVDTDFHDKIPELLPFRPEMRDYGSDGPGIDAEVFEGRSWKTILVIDVGKPGVDPWLDRLPRLVHEDYVEYA